jgi:hypothetical protein
METNNERAMRIALEELRGEYGCTLVAPPDPSLPAQGLPCRDRRPTDSSEWCYACIASDALERVHNETTPVSGNTR